MLLMGSARDLERGIRDELYSHMLSLDMAYYDKTRAGDIMAHATSDIIHVRMAFGFGIIALVDTLLLGSACIGIMIWTSPKLAALMSDSPSFSGFDHKKSGQQDAPVSQHSPGGFFRTHRADSGKFFRYPGHQSVQF